MELYFAPLACSMATRIALYEARIPATFTLVDLKNKRVAADGSDFLTINAMGQVPVLRTDDGALLTENPAVLQYVADRGSKTGLASESGVDRYRLQQWLCFITSELHKVIFIPLLDKASTWCQSLCTREDCATVRISQPASRAQVPPARPVYGSRRLSRDRAQLDARDCNRSSRMAGHQHLFCRRLPAPERRPSAWRGDYSLD